MIKQKIKNVCKNSGILCHRFALVLQEMYQSVFTAHVPF